MRNWKLFALVCITVMLVSIIAVGCGNDYKKAIVGKWELTESNMDKSMLPEVIEFFADGNAKSESNDMMGMGYYTESFTWKIEGKNVLNTVSSGVTQKYTITELTSTRLTYEGTFFGLGDVWFKFTKK